MRCEHKDDGGRQCRAQALNGRARCFFHAQEEETRQRRLEAQTRGGSRPKKTRANLPPLQFNFEDPRKISSTLTKLAELVYTGGLDVKDALAIGRLAGLALAALDAGVFADEIARLKRRADAENAQPIENYETAGHEAVDPLFASLLENIERSKKEKHEQAACNEAPKDATDPEGAQ